MVHPLSYMGNAVTVHKNKTTNRRYEMKRLLGICLLVTTMIFSGCASSTDATDTVVNSTETVNEKVNIVVTSFHEYDWMTQVIGEDSDAFDVTLLINDGVDLHSYEPTVEDIATIASSDLFIYNGGESDSWVDDILAANSELNTISVIELLGSNTLDEVTVEGMEEEEHDHDHDDEETTEEEHDHDHDDEETTEEEHDHDDEETDEEEHDHDDEDSHTDEHVWLSLKNAAIICAQFADLVAEFDADNADTYQANADNYIAELNALDEAYETMVAEADRDTFIVTDRFPFLYLATDYNLNYYAAFSGCSAETEASFETIAFLAEKVNEYDVNYVVIIENGLEDLASTIINNSDDSSREVLVLNSIQSVTQSDIDAGVTYLSLMEENLEALTQILAQ